MTVITINDIPVKVKIASTPDEQAKGLMNTQGQSPINLPDNEGMLFIYNREEILTFWMKNTSLPLSIAFIDKNKKIIDIHKMKPNDKSQVRSGMPAKYALEVNQGWFSKNNIKAGDEVMFPENIFSKLVKIRII
jgi:hypothetical protein